MLALPWALAWNRDRRRELLLSPIAQLLTIIPPLGLIGVACPLAAAGLLLPGTAWLGLLATLLLPGAVAVWPRLAPMIVGATVLAAHLSSDGVPRARMNWEAVNTAREQPESPVQEYEAIDGILTLAQESKADVIVFPETAVPKWTNGTDAFWHDSIARLAASGKTVLIGSTIAMASPGVPPDPFDFADALSILNGVRAQDATAVRAPEMSYHNAVVIRGEQSGLFIQRIPVPLAMWNPFSDHGVSLNLAGPPVMDINGQRTAIFVCYEQLLTFPVITAMTHHPSIMVGVANLHSISGMPVSRMQELYLQSWAQLFDLPVITATNH